MVRLDDARRIIAAAEKKAGEIGQPMNIAVADEGGNLVAHVRMDGAWIGSVDISIKKAWTAARGVIYRSFKYRARISRGSYWCSISAGGRVPI